MSMILPRKPRTTRALAAMLAGSVAICPIAYAQLGSNEDRVLFEADAITRQSQESPIVASGSVKAYFGERFLTSDKVTYNPTTDIVIASGNVTITDTEGQTYFADDVELTGDLADGIATNFSAMLDKNSKIAGSRVIKTGDEKNELENAVYSACEVCKEDGSPKTPSWQVKAVKVTQDKEDQVIRFNNARFEVLGVPVFYTPYMQIPDPEVERQSGFLTPDVGTTDLQGLYVEAPYYWSISEHQDVTFSPKFMAQQNVLVKGEYRIKRHNAEAVIQAGFIDARDAEIERLDSPTTPIPDNRFHFFGEGQYRFNKAWEAGFDIDHVSDKTYITFYNVVPKDELSEPTGVFRPDRLSSKVNLSRHTNNSRFDIEWLGFQSLRSNEDNDFAAQAFPRINYERQFKDIPFFGGQGEIKSNLLMLIRRQGLDTIRSISSANWDRVFTSSGGHRFKLFTELRGDIYKYSDIGFGNETCNSNLAVSVFQNCFDDFPDGGIDQSTTQTRFLPTVGAEWSYPLARQTENATIVIEPKVQLVASTEDDFNREIPQTNAPSDFVTDFVNEDSQSFEFDTTSLFDWNKSSGYDLWENGQRANVGISVAALYDNGFAVEGTIGQQFRTESTNIYSAYGLSPGLGDTESDIVASLDMRWKNYLNFDSDVRVDKDDGTIRRAQSQLRGRYGRFGGNMTYVKIQTGATNTPDSIGEFATAALYYNIDKNWTVGGSWREDLQAGTTTSQTLSLGYTDECTRILFDYRIDNTNSNGISFGDSLNVNLELAGFGN